MRVVLLHNPGSGGPGPDEADLREVVTAAGHEMDHRSVKDEGWEEALDGAYDLVAIAGGDGTVHDVCTALAGTAATVTIIPLGTANNVERSLGISVDDPLATIAGWSSARRRRLDLPLATIGDRTLRFVESVGAGFLGDLLVATEDGPGGGDSGMSHGLSELAGVVASAAVQDWEVAIDGDVVSAELFACEITNVGTVGPGVVVAPEADPGDGLVEVVMMPPETRAGLVDHLLACARGARSAPPPLPVRRGRHVELRPPPGCRLHVDDELVEAAARFIGVMIDGTSLEVLVPS
ncbi:MAG: hypothetical protein JJE52_00985 [Acidimicrobiia bacterium]|nr:hypothetical protein [Acidimicrobiia bacterium]